jgi:hypothetical protein
MPVLIRDIGAVEKPSSAALHRKHCQSPFLHIFIIAKHFHAIYLDFFENSSMHGVFQQPHIHSLLCFLLISGCPQFSPI